MAKLMKWEIDHLEKKVRSKVDPLIEHAELMVKQFKTIETNKAVNILSKKMGADKILARFKKLEEDRKELQQVAKTFFQSKADKEQKENLSYKFSNSDRHSYRDNDDITLSDCEEQLRTWASNITDRLIEKRPEGKELSRLKKIKQCALDHVKESNINKDLPNILNNLFTQSLGITWNEEIKALPSTTKN